MRAYCNICKVWYRLNDYKAANKHGHKIKAAKVRQPVFVRQPVEVKENDKLINRWAKLQKQVFGRDKYMCRRCGSKRNLVVHHVRPQSTYKEGVFRKQNCITLCNNCHYKEHRPWLEAKELDREYRAIVT